MLTHVVCEYLMYDMFVGGGDTVACPSWPPEIGGCDGANAATSSRFDVLVCKMDEG